MNRFHRWYCRTGHWRHAIQDQILPWVLRDVDLGDHALEVGPGPGLTTDVLATRVPKLTGSRSTLSSRPSCGPGSTARTSP